MRRILSLIIFALIGLVAVTQGLKTRTVTGQVACDGQPLAGVAVTDGFNVVRTDQQGHYTIVCPDGARFVYLTTPAGYLPPLGRATVPAFYHRLAQGQDRYDFELQRNPRDDHRHTLIVQADAQVTALADLDQYGAQVAEMARLTASITDRDVLGLDCGDIVGDSPWLFPEYLKRVESLHMPVYRVIGNHDMDYNGRSHETSHHTFEDYFGPDHYSFDRGQVHYIVINDNFYIGREFYYMGYCDESTFHWLEQDLSGVKPGSLVVMAMHIPTRLTPEQVPFAYEYGPIADQMVNAQALHNVLKPYRVHIISGHMHYNLNIEHSDRLYEHNTAAACGTWWRLPECLDGAPRGYAIYDFDGDRVRWRYKGVGRADDYQLTAYRPGADPDHPDEVVANVWNYDSRWRVELLENGRVTAQMQQFTGYDPKARIDCADRKKVVYEWITPNLTHHLFKAQPKNPDAHIQVRATDRWGRTYTSTAQSLKP